MVLLMPYCVGGSKAKALLPLNGAFAFIFKGKVNGY
jgi:hypothetical protein